MCRQAARRYLHAVAAKCKQLNSYETHLATSVSGKERGVPHHADMFQVLHRDDSLALMSQPLRASLLSHLTDASLGRMLQSSHKKSDDEDRGQDISNVWHLEVPSSKYRLAQGGDPVVVDSPILFKRRSVANR